MKPTQKAKNLFRMRQSFATYRSDSIVSSLLRQLPWTICERWDTGKLQFHIEALDRDAKKPHERPTICMLLCATKDNEVGKYALTRSLSPTLIAEAA